MGWHCSPEGWRRLEVSAEQRRREILLAVQYAMRRQSKRAKRLGGKVARRLGLKR
jgi:hypothetical protein